MTRERSRDEIDDQISKAGEQTIDGKPPKWPGMTYEQGVENALRWVIGDDDTPPMDEEE